MKVRPLTPAKLVSDRRLVERAVAGDQAAFGQIFERHGGALYRYCRSILRHDEDAQDVLQTTMERALASLSRKSAAAPLRAWLFRIAHNESVSVLRSRRIAVPYPEDFAGTFDLETQVAARDRLATLITDLDELPERQRAALLMRELCGLSHAEIGTALAITVPAVKQAIFDARTGLRQFEEGRSIACEAVQRTISDGDGRALRSRQIRSHLRNCGECRLMRDSIRSRRRDLGAWLPLAPFGGAGLIWREIEGFARTSTAAGEGAGVASGAAPGVASIGAGVAKVGALLITPKVAAVATATVVAAGTFGQLSQPGPESIVPTGQTADLSPTGGGDQVADSSRFAFLGSADTEHRVSPKPVARHRVGGDQVALVGGSVSQPVKLTQVGRSGDEANRTAIVVRERGPRSAAMGPPGRVGKPETPARGRRSPANPPGRPAHSVDNEGHPASPPGRQKTTSEGHKGRAEGSQARPAPASPDSGAGRSVGLAAALPHSPPASGEAGEPGPAQEGTPRRGDRPDLPSPDSDVPASGLGPVEE